MTTAKTKKKLPLHMMIVSSPINRLSHCCCCCIDSQPANQPGCGSGSEWWYLARKHNVFCALNDLWVSAEERRGFVSSFFLPFFYGVQRCLWQSGGGIAPAWLCLQWWNVVCTMYHDSYSFPTYVPIVVRAGVRVWPWLGLSCCKVCTTCRPCLFIVSVLGRWRGESKTC